jgi:orotate phosphoribosyltransferase
VTAQPASTLDLFLATGAYLKGHFRLTSGLHSPEYLQCALVLSYPQHAERFGRELASRLSALTPFDRPAYVVAPAMGGLIIGHEVAKALGSRFLFTEREGGAMTLRRGFQVEEGEKAVVVEDVITTGGSSLEVIDLLRGRGVEVLAAASIIDRSGGQADLGVRRVALETLSVKTYSEETCPMCRQGIPVYKPGSRKS